LIEHGKLEQGSVLSLARQGSDGVPGDERVFGAWSVLRVRKGLKGKKAGEGGRMRVG